MASDPIPNIRFNVAKTLEKIANNIAPKHKKAIEEQVKVSLQKMAQDKDTDVRFFAQQALNGTLFLKKTFSLIFFILFFF